MKFHSLALFIIISLVFISCKKEKDVVGKGMIYVVPYYNGKDSLPGAECKLYYSFNDWKDQKNQLGKTQWTDENGIAVFNDLEEGHEYYCRVQLGCINNANYEIYDFDWVLKAKASEVVSSSQGIIAYLRKSIYLKVTNQSNSNASFLVVPFSYYPLLPGESVDNPNYYPGKYSFSFNKVGSNVPFNCNVNAACGDSVEIILYDNNQFLVDYK